MSESAKTLGDVASESYTKRQIYMKAFNKAYRIKNAEKLRAKKREWTKKNPEKRQAILLAFRKRHAERLRASQSAWRINNRDRKRAINRAWREKNREKTRESAAKWRENNWDKVLAMATAWRKANAVKLRTQGRGWYRKNFDKLLARRKQNPQRFKGYLTKYRNSPNGRSAFANAKARRRAREMGCLATVTTKELSEIKKSAKGICFYCKRAKPLTFDHVIPLSKHGSHTKENIVMACFPCNFSKQAKQVEQFLKEKGFNSVEIPAIQLHLMAC